MCALVRPKNTIGNTIQQHTTVLVSEDGVLEGWLLLVADNLLDVGTLLLDASFEGWEIVALLNLAEIRSAERKAALYQERVLTLASCILSKR